MKSDIKHLKGTEELAMKVARSCPTLCDPTGILEDRILEWVTYSSPADLPNPGIKLKCPALQVDSLPTELSGNLKE